MAKDNTLGAPTEGLGQTVTFAAQGGSGTPQLTLPERGAVRIGTGGGNVTSTGQARQVQEARPDPTMAALMKMGGAILQPAIKREQDAQFMQGMQRAAQEEAITEIVNEQPWYSKLFGSTSLVDGARVWKANALVTDLAANLEGNAEEIAKMPGDAFSRHLNNMLSDNLSGDGPTDMAVRQQFMNQMPDIMRKQAKNHGLWQKQDAIESNRKSVAANLNRLVLADASARNPKKANADGSIPGSDTDGGDLLTVGIEAIKAMDTPVGMDAAVHKQMLSAEVIKSINGGSFAVFNMLEDGQMLDRFEPAQVSAMRGAVTALRTAKRADLPLEFAKILHKARESARIPGQTQAGIDKELLALNTEYKRITGDPVDYAKAEAASSLYDLLERQKEQDLREAERRRNAARASGNSGTEDKNHVLQLVENLTIGVPVNYAKATDKRDAWAWLETTDPSRAFATRVMRYETDMDENFRDKLRNEINMAVSSGSADTFHATYMARYLPLVEAAGGMGEAAALAYAGKGGDVMSAYHRAYSSSATKGRATIDSSFALATSPAAKPLTPAEKLIETELKSRIPDFLRSADNVVRDPAAYSRLLAPHVSYSTDMGESIKAAKANAKEHGVTLLDGYAWKRDPRQADLRTFFQKNKLVASNEHHDAMAFGLDTVKRESGMDNVINVIQIADAADATPQLQVIGTTPSGDTTFYTITGKRLEQLWDTRKSVKKARGDTAKDSMKSALPGLNLRN
jgi:hypothetical protein